jgi:hypothetical protein
MSNQYKSNWDPVSDFLDRSARIFAGNEGRAYFVGGRRFVVGGDRIHYLDATQRKNLSLNANIDVYDDTTAWAAVLSAKLDDFEARYNARNPRTPIRKQPYTYTWAVSPQTRVVVAGEPLERGTVVSIGDDGKLYAVRPE